MNSINASAFDGTPGNAVGQGLGISDAHGDGVGLVEFDGAPASERFSGGEAEGVAVEDIPG
jgi:hypothetical protein